MGGQRAAHTQPSKTDWTLEVLLLFDLARWLSALEGLLLRELRVALSLFWGLRLGKNVSSMQKEARI